ncbi:co-chaperone SGT1 [Paracoccidioides brasiliensis Pb18]|uniref:SGT1 and CS domain-containing protein n=2 Tax=Paracoccidioides brasiliensis TaxID=121759 RepID=C1GJL6_PARBD|nr:co-chaperone SGT1 [Paracoccidioides brasiliensis Pb18]EEH42632.1 hypothetical protein PADG_07452 [Paracoccidioides brasiliensis Pb18]ODH13866.1 hypothetical protein ACO22_06827 [Paracoccidioides brasiliensis]
MDEAQRGAKALSASNFPAAIEHYTRALAINPHATDYYIKRSTAYSRLRPADGGPNGQAALHDAEMAVALGLKRARREQILSSQMRRAIVLYHLERYGDADFLFKLVRDKVGPAVQNTVKSAMTNNNGSTAAAKANRELDIWEMKVAKWVKTLGKDDERMQVTVKEYPDIKVPEAAELKEIFRKQLAAVDVGEEKGSVDKGKDASRQENGQPPAEQEQSDSPPTVAPQAPLTNKVRHEWYQTADTVVITLYAKGVPKEKADIDIQEDSLSITFPLASGSDFSFNLEPLFAPVDSSVSKTSVMSTKIEVVLRKKQSSLKWAALEGTHRQANPTGANNAAPPITPTSILSSQPSTLLPTEGVPSYPTSSRTGLKDWDKVASSLTKKKEKKKSSSKGKEIEAAGSEDDNDDEGLQSDDSDYGTGDPVDAFFKKLYANADPDTRRAMVKSYYESEGTALSTNWSEVSKGKVEPKPPSDD